ncbi:MAG: polyprenyl synthetase family protein [Cyanobacteria bacterium]|nr:polyprenyl synthetase family protein [Cyanobacteriota bacterium]
MTTTSSKPTLRLSDALVRSLEQVKTSLLKIVPPESELMAETIQHSLTSGGKYLRPVITLLMGSATGAFTKSLEESLIEVAAVSEMIHIATLLHDDVLDQSDLRRNRKTVRALWGNTVSVLSGDYLLAQASLKLANVGNIRIVSIFSHVLADLCDGEVEQIKTSFDLETSWESYYKKSICKTASLFSAGCESAGVLNLLPEEQIQRLKSYGRNFGISFQIVDDLLDYISTADEMGKPVLDDLRNGILNAPVLLALESKTLTTHEKDQLKAFIQEVFLANTEDAKEKPLQDIRELLIQSGAIEKTIDLANDYAEKAIETISFLPDGEEKTTLVDLLKNNLNRRQ